MKSDNKQTSIPGEALLDTETGLANAPKMPMNRFAEQVAPIRGIDETAPVISRGDTFIAAPIETIWNIQTHISGWTQWRPTVTAAHHEGVLEVGSAFPWEEGGLQIVSTVQELVPMHRIVWTGPAQGIEAIHVWEFTSTVDGVRVHTEESWAGDVVAANAAMLKPLLDNALQEWLMQLKLACEAAAD